MSIPDRIARLTNDGATDGSFDPGGGLNGEGLCVAVLPDGRVIAGGSFTMAGGAARARLAVLEADGTPVATELNANGAVRCLLCQTDGKVIAGGDFTSFNSGVARQRLARLRADFTLEPAFNPAANGAVHTGGLGADGKITVGGAFTQTGGLTRNRLVKLHNSDAHAELTATSASRIQWLRSGAGPETLHVTFELSDDDGTTWELLEGDLARIAGGWEMTGLSLGGGGRIRARACTGSGTSSGGVQEATFDFLPEIQVEQPAGTVLADGAGSVAFGGVQTGSTAEKVFVIRNTGAADLGLTGSTPVTLGGVNAGLFSIEEQPDSPVPAGESMTFAVRFSPSSLGNKNATLSIASDDDDEGSFEVALTGAGMPGPGAREMSFQPLFDDVPKAVATSPAGIFVGGYFKIVNGQNRGRFARFTLGGTLLAQSSSGANLEIYCLAVMPDGKMLIGGSFVTVDGKARKGLARLNADGSLDTSFTTVTDGEVTAMAVQADGMVLITGIFTKCGGLSRPNIARLTASGTVDAGFNPGVSGVPFCVAVQEDGKILVGGHFRTIASITRPGLARLNANGTPDASFDALLLGTGSVAPAVMTVAVAADGKILIGGNFDHIHGTARKGLNRLNNDGTLDTTFAEVVTYIRSIAIQADGKVIIAGNSDPSVGTDVPRLIRVDEAGVEDTTFTAGITNSPTGVTLQSDGSALVSGRFTLSGATVFLAKLINGPASSALSVEKATILQWLRGGSAPETQAVTFEVSQDNGGSWNLLGYGSRIEGGWRLTGAALPISGIVRAQARAPGDRWCASNGMHEERVDIPAGLPISDVEVCQPSNRLIPSGGGGLEIIFPGVQPSPGGGLSGQTTEITITLSNPGNAPLTGITAKATPGPTGASSEWSVISNPPATLAAGAAAELVVRFSPAAIGYRTGTLTLTSNVPGVKKTYTVPLRGAGIGAPTVVTNAATNIAATQARLNGSVKPNHDAAHAYFEYKAQSAPDTAWIKAPAGEIPVAGFASVPVSQDITGLTSGVAYHYRLVFVSSYTSSPVRTAALATFVTH